MVIEKKMIKILSKGPLYEIHGVYGPILSPYMEKIKTIAAMLKNGKKVVEVLLDKSEVPLTLENFNIDLNVPIIEKKPEPVKELKKYEAPTIIEVVKAVEPVKIEELVVVAPSVMEVVFAPTPEEPEVVVPIQETLEVAPPVEEKTIEVPKQEGNTFNNKAKYNKYNNNK